MLRQKLLHNTRLMPFRLLIAFALSFALHGILLFPGLLKRFSTPPPRPVLQATLRLPPRLEPAPFEPILKDTLVDEETKPAVLSKPPPTPTPKQASRRMAQHQVQEAQRKLSKHLYYPAEAVERGIEGEVRLILKISAEGRVESVTIGSGSGHTILDKAAVKAAWAMGNLSAGEPREMIVPVSFYLQ